MKTRKIQCLALGATLLLTTSMAWAQPDHDDHGQRGSQAHYSHNHGGRDHDDHHGDHPGYGDRHRYGDRGGYAVAPRHWHRGGYLPGRYRAHRYVIYHYGYYGLPRPARGHRWVRVDNDFLLTAIATGAIISIVAAH